MSEPTDSMPQQDARLPFDLRTFLLGLKRRWPLFLLFPLLAVPAGLLAGNRLGARSWEARTVLLYRLGEAGGKDEVLPPLSTQIHMVKMPANLEATREHLQLDCNLQTLGQACSATIERDTNLMTILAHWDDPQTAADIANTLRDVFLETQGELLEAEAGGRLREVEARLASSRQELQAVEAELSAFSVEHQAVDLEQRSQAYLEELGAVSLQLEQAEIDRKANAQKISRLQDIVTELEQQVAREKAEAPAPPDPGAPARITRLREQIKEMEQAEIDRKATAQKISRLQDIVTELERQVARERAEAPVQPDLGAAAARITRLRELIRENKDRRIDQVDLAQKKIEAERYKWLWEQGAVSEMEYRRAETEYEKLKAGLEEPDQVKAWRAELEQLERQSGRVEEFEPPSAALLQQMRSQLLNLRVEAAALEDRIEHLRSIRSGQGPVSEIEGGRVETGDGNPRVGLEEPDQIKTWRAELQQLERQSGKVEGFEPPSAALLEEMRSQLLNLRVEASALEDRIEHLRSVRNQIQAKLDVLPGLYGRFQALNERVAEKRAEVQRLEEQLPPLQQVYERGQAAFELVTPATPPLTPASSTRRLLAIGVAGLITVLGWALVIGLELLDTRIKSSAELGLKLTLPGLGQVPRVRARTALSIAEPDAGLRPYFLLIGKRLRQAVPERGARVLVVSSRHGEGKTLVAAQLACHLATQEERVLLVEAQLPAGDRPQHRLTELLPDSGEPVEDLADHLSAGEVRREVTGSPTVFAGVECLAQVQRPITAEMVGSPRLRELLQQVSSRYSLVLVDAPPLIPYVETELLAEGVDAILLVVESRRCRAATLKKASARLQEAGLFIAGTVLNGVEPIYLERS